MAHSILTYGAGLAIVLVMVATAFAFQDAEKSDEPEKSSPPPAKPADVASIEAILASLYDVISGPAGAERDWDRMRSLFHPEANLIPCRGQAQGHAVADFRTLEDWISGAAPFFEQNGFYETEIHRKVERYGHIAHVFSTYTSRRTPEADPFDRGINSIQLLHDGTRWWIVNIFWNSERGAGAIPARYLPAEK